MTETELIRSLQRQVKKIEAGFDQLAGDSAVPTFAEFGTQYQATKLASSALRTATKRSFEYQMRCHLIPAFGLMPINKIGPREWLNWVALVRQRGGLTRFFNVRKALVEVLRSAQESGYIERMPKLENPDERRNVGRVLEDNQVRTLLRNTKKDFFRGFFRVLWKTGLRPRSVLRWEWSMIRWGEPGHTWIDMPARISKNDRPVSVPLHPRVSRWLAAKLKRGVTSKYIFPCLMGRDEPQLSYHGAWMTAARRSRLSCVPYDLRRSFITKAAANNRPLLYVAKCLDTSVKMIEGVYAKAQTEVMEAIVS